MSEHKHLTGEDLATDIAYLFGWLTLTLASAATIIGVFAVVRIAQHDWFWAATDSLSAAGFVWMWVEAHRRAAKYAGLRRSA